VNVGTLTWVQALGFPQHRCEKVGMAGDLFGLPGHFTIQAVEQVVLDAIVELGTDELLVLTICPPTGRQRVVTGVEQYTTDKTRFLARPTPMDLVGCSAQSDGKSMPR
jgi:hypothetical protein